MTGASGNTGTGSETSGTVALPVPSPAENRPGSGTGRVQKCRVYILLRSGVKNMCGDKKTPKLGTDLDLPAEAVSRGASPACAHPWGCTGLKAKAHKEDTWGGSWWGGGRDGSGQTPACNSLPGKSHGCIFFCCSGLICPSMFTTQQFASF